MNHPPGILQVVDELARMVDDKAYGSLTITVRHGIIVHIERAISIQPRQSEERSRSQTQGAFSKWPTTS